MACVRSVLSLQVMAVRSLFDWLGSLDKLQCKAMSDTCMGDEVSDGEREKARRKCGKVCINHWYQ